jgi:hypothetical protein
MKLVIKLSGKTLYETMRTCGYSPGYGEAKRTEFVFQRLITGRPYPKFHIYASLNAEKKTASLNLHLDQKQPSYKGFSAHSGEYSGSVVEQEVARIQNIAGPRES